MEASPTIHSISGEMDSRKHEHVCVGHVCWRFKNVGHKYVAGLCGFDRPQFLVIIREPLLNLPCVTAYCKLFTWRRQSHLRHRLWDHCSPKSYWSGMPDMFRMRKPCRVDKPIDIVRITTQASNCHDLLLYDPRSNELAARLPGLDLLSRTAPPQ